MEQHIALQTDENLRAGMSPVEARRQAVLKFGAREAIERISRSAGVAVPRKSDAGCAFRAADAAQFAGVFGDAILTMALGIERRRRFSAW